jgi:hypothetical protein
MGKKKTEDKLDKTDAQLDHSLQKSVKHPGQEIWVSFKFFLPPLPQRDREK